LVDRYALNSQMEVAYICELQRRERVCDTPVCPSLRHSVTIRYCATTAIWSNFIQYLTAVLFWLFHK